MERRRFFRNAAIASAAGLSITIPGKGFSAMGTSLDCPSGFINIVDTLYGADPSGESSSALAFTLAAEHSTATGNPIWVPAGIYDVSDLPTLSTGDLVIIGAGSDLVSIIGSDTKPFISPKPNSLLRLSGIAASGFQRIIRYDNYINLNSIEINNCKFYNIAQQVIGSGAGVNIEKIERFIFENNIVTNIGFDDADAAAIKLSTNKCNFTRISDNIIDTIGTESNSKKSFGIYVKAASATDDSHAKTTITGNKIQNIRNGSLADCEGVMVLGGQAIIKDNHIEDIISSDTNTSDNEGIYTKCRSSIISGNTLVNCGGREGVIICKGRNRDEPPGTSAFGYDNIISNNTIRQDSNLGFRTTGISITMDGCIVESNLITGTQNGIAIWTGVSNTIIKSNIIYGLTARDKGYYVYGIAISNPEVCSILDNQLTNFEGTPDQPCYGILIVSSATKFSGCLVRGNWLAKLNPAGSSLSRGIAVNIHVDSIGEKIIIESNHISEVGRGIYANNLPGVYFSSALNNTVSGELSSISPSSVNWNLFENNSIL